MRLARLMLVIALTSLTAISWPESTCAERPYSSGSYDKDRPSGQRGRNVAGQFDYLVLVMSWSPTHCASLTTNDYDPQCHRNDGRRYNFVLHGVWPQYEQGYPEYCPISRRPFVPQQVVDSMQDIMPSKRLTIHEYKKHGTCSGLDPAGYFALSRRLFKTIKVPDRYINPFESQFVTPDDLAEEFLRDNPQLTADMLVVSCGGPGNRLREVRICFTKDGTPRACGHNENQGKLCSARQMFVPPVRSTYRGPGDSPGGGGARDNDSPLPAPRLIPSPRQL